ncbi:DUF1801 domain-containing protein [Dactylosporangium sp. NPDC051541]|uniref:DUF1801 domain-containing protein n=1 Tax=Dactylosporangium sp. NPDC051541 TaxID=3363977 RepID=UPI0037931355
MTGDGVPSEFEELLAEHCASIGALTRHLREVILAARPDLTERVYRGWPAVGFHHPSHGCVAAVYPARDHVSVGFEHGADLPDPHGLLEGTGRRLRYLRFKPDDSAPTHEHLIEYLSLAAG